MTPTYWKLVVFGAALLLSAGLLTAVHFYLRSFFWRVFFCLAPVVIAGLVVASAEYSYEKGEKGGWKLGVDLVGGTILVYEVDVSKFPEGQLPKEYKREQLAASLKRRIDPADLYNVTIRPVTDTRVEIILPTGGQHQAEIEEAKWKDLLAAVTAKWPPSEESVYDSSRGKVTDLIELVAKDHPEVKPEEVRKFIDDNYQPSKNLSGEQVQSVKEKIKQVGLLEFRILANQRDDKEGIQAAIKYLEEAPTLPERKAELDKRARLDQPPPSPPLPTDHPDGFPTTRSELGPTTYTWVELGRSERFSLHLNNAAETEADPNNLWHRVAEARAKGKCLEMPDQMTVLYSRPCVFQGLSKEDEDKNYEYFLLTRDPQKGKAVTGDYLVNATEGNDQNGQLAVNFTFNSAGGALFYELTSANTPKAGGGTSFPRYLAIILDHQIMSAPSLKAVISTNGQITGHFTKPEVDRLVTILRAGALPATLKPQPVSENTMGATLGAETIRKGTLAVGLAFLMILVFMIIYYRFAGFVASVALLANLLLTVAFMAAVNATFTLPGLAGLVLMLGMAVDANVLIYERLREERDRGASLALAIRNGYDRAFPTIIDTHLSSIFTAIVLYAVGNDQLKGFGVSLTVGLIISLFTSLLMTRVLFDIWLARGWLHKLSMFRLFSRPNINFMGIRYYWFTATILLTIIGISVFIFRLPQDLNIDFNGGTAYTGQLVDPLTIKELRDRLEGGQKTLLDVREGDVKQLDQDGYSFAITYSDGKTRTIDLPNPATPQEVLERARQLPDLSVEQIFPSTEVGTGNASRFFTVRTSEKAPDLVQASISRLLGGEHELKRIEMASFEVDKTGKAAILTFGDYALPNQVSTLLEREFKKTELKPGEIPQSFTLTGEGTGQRDRFQKMRLQLTDPVVVSGDQFKQALVATQNEFKERPQPDALDNFDSQLAQETQTRAMYAILASWGAILLYLWFRFGSWTFGLAAVLCLIHDLFFTMGIIAFCHYVQRFAPGLASALKIEDFKIDLPAVAALLTLVGYSVNDTIVVFDRIREVRGKNPELTPQTINDSVNQTLSRTLLTSFATWLVVIVLYLFGGEGVHLFAFCMVIGVVVGTYSSIYIASPLLLIFGEGARPTRVRERQPQPVATPG